jgi:hypothetical protein
MTIDRSTEYLLSLLNELRKLPRETEWVEFKHNNGEPEEIGIEQDEEAAISFLATTTDGLVEFGAEVAP